MRVQWTQTKSIYSDKPKYKFPEQPKIQQNALKVIWAGYGRLSPSHVVLMDMEEYNSSSSGSLILLIKNVLKGTFFTGLD